MDKDKETALVLPDETQFRADIQAINKFQGIVRANMKEGHDFGIIPGTQKPTLLKPGAEKIAKLLGLADRYEIMDRQEDWQKPFFRYLVKCSLVSVASGITISEGLGECNSMETKYRWRWIFQSELPSSLQGEEGKTERDKLVSRTIQTRTGKAKQYRFENEDIYSQVNTILKMAKKRALVDASLSAGRLSDVFTQDIEDVVEDKSQLAPKDSKPKETKADAKQAEQADKDSKELWPEGGSEGISAEESPSEGEEPIKTVDDLFEWIRQKMNWKSATPVRSWIINKCKIQESKIEDDPLWCYYEIKALQGW